MNNRSPLSKSPPKSAEQNSCDANSQYPEPDLGNMSEFEHSRLARKTWSIADQLHGLVVAFGLEDEFEQGKFTCPLTGVRVTRDNLGRIQINGKSVTLFSANERACEKATDEGSDRFIQETTSLLTVPKWRCC